MRSSLDLHLPDALNTLLLHTLVEGTRLSHKGRIRWAADAALLIAEGGINWRRGVEVLKRIRQPPPMFGTAQDQPTPARFTGTVVVASTPRSGSTLLCSALERTGLVGVPREYLLPRFLESGHRVLGVPHPTAREAWRRLRRRLRLEREWWGYWEIDPATMAAYIQGLVARRSYANGIFSLKIHWQHFEQARRMGFCPSQLPQPITWIYIERRDRIAQAVSLEKARRSGAFVANEERAHRVDHLPYDDGRILSAYALLLQGANGWERYFKSAGITPVPVIYEDLAADYESTIARVLEALGFANVPVPPPLLQRQANRMNERWIEAFRLNHPELRGPERHGDGHPGPP